MPPADSGRCPHPPLPRGHLMVGVAARIAFKWWYQYTHHAAGSSPLWGVHGAGGKAGVEPIPKQIDSGRRRPAVGRRARGGRSRWSRSTSPGAGRPGGCMGARAAAMWTRPGQRRRCTAARPVHEQARGEAGGGRRPGRRKYLCIRTDGQTHKNPEVGSFSLTSFRVIKTHLLLDLPRASKNGELITSLCEL